MKRLFLFLLLASATLALAPTIKWDANPEPEVIGYRIYSGLSSRVYDGPLDVPDGATWIQLPAPLPNQMQYYAVTAYAADGQESDFSAEVTYVFPPAPTLDLSISAGGTMKVSFVGQSGYRYGVEASEDLVTWTEVAVVASLMDGERADWFDTDAPNHSKRFYRVARTIAP